MKVYVIKDNQGKYVDGDSIYFDKTDKKAVYRSNSTYINSKILYSEDKVDTIIEYLKQKSEQYNLGYTFTKEFVFKSDY